LDIFDAYRQLYQLQPDYETLWNSRVGWFKLAHVCLRWRRLVLLSSSRLHVHLLFSPRRSSSDPVLRCLPRLPTLVDYCAVSWTEKEEDLALAAIMHNNRVRGICLRRPCAGRLLQALSQPLPELESFKICSTSTYLNEPELILPATFLSSAPCLRRLTLREVTTRCLSPVLSSATGLVELVLTLRVAHGAPPEALLIANLQRLSCLRRLDLKLSIRGIVMITDSPSPPDSAEDVVPLSKLTDFIFMGNAPYLEMLVVRLAAPSLQHLDADVWAGSPIFPIPNLCKFIRDTECQFTAVRVDLLQWKLKFSAETYSVSDYAQPFRITLPESVSLELIGNMLSGPLSTVEEFVVGWDAARFPQERDIQWRGFFNHIPKVKMVQVTSDVAVDVAHSFQPDGQEPVMDLLPALEHVKVHMTHLPPIGLFPPIESNSNDQYAPIHDAFEPLIAARQQVGRPVWLSWS
jgi:hypothetical protein